DIDSLKQVEIVRGPASAVFGSDALGGVVSFVTMGPRDVLGDSNQRIDVSAGYNSVDTSQQLRVAAAFAGENVATLFRVTGRQGNERDVNIADPLDDESRNLFARFDFGDGTAGGLSLTLENFLAESDTDVDSREGTQDFTAGFGFPYVITTSVVEGNDERERNRVSLGQEWLPGRFGTDYLRWRAYWQNSTTPQDTFEARESFIAGTPASVERNRRFEFEQDLLGFEVNVANDFELGETTHQLAYGFEFEQTDTDQIRTGTELNLLNGVSSNVVGPDDFPVRDFPLSTTERVGVYVQNRIEFGTVAIIPGLRWDRYALDPRADPIFADDNPGITPVSIDDNQVSPKLGLTWDANESLQFYAQYSEGFRAPPVNDVNVGFTNFQFGYTALPNPDLRSESSKGYEVGARIETQTLAFEVSTFVTRYDDFIESFQVVGFDPINQLLQFQSVNVDDVEILGGEIGGTFAPTALPDGMRIRFAAAYAEGENRVTGEYLNSIAPLNGVLGLEYDAPSDRWGLSLVARGAERQDKLDNSDGPRLSPAGYVVFDAFG
ncbi:MAG: TonB-dependent receptor, partial [Planctomycetota bacterium]